MGLRLLQGQVSPFKSATFLLPAFLTLQGTQKLCLPYSPTKTLSVKSILR